MTNTTPAYNEDVDAEAALCICESCGKRVNSVWDLHSEVNLNRPGYTVNVCSECGMKIGRLWAKMRGYDKLYGL